MTDLVPSKEVCLSDMVEVLIPIEAGVLAALADAYTRASTGRVISRVLRPRLSLGEFAQAIADAKAGARDAGLTEADIDTELERIPADWSWELPA